MLKYACQYEKGATVTVFAPYDCGNHCPFCVNKKEYQEDRNFDVNNVIESMRKMHDITPSCDFVFTGGEPFADLKSLRVLLDAVRGMNLKNMAQKIEPHCLYINTTFPTYQSGEKEMLDLVEEYKDTITGINVSRHIKKYVKECEDSVFDLIPVPVRINCVLFDPKEGLYAKEFMDRFLGYKSIVGIQFREDYTMTTLDNLYILDNDEVPTFKYVLSQINVNSKEEIEDHFKKHCLAQNDFRWNCEIVPNVTYHRTLPFSTITLENGAFEINDIIINPRGVIKSDWNEYGEELDLEAYKDREYK